MATKEKKDTEKIIGILGIVFGILIILKPDILGILVGLFLIIMGIQKLLDI